MNITHKKRQLTSGISIVAVAAAMSFATPAGAQSAGSTLRGHAPAGQQVVATETSTGAVRTTTEILADEIEAAQQRHVGDLA